MAGPWLSVILPACNGEAYVARALESVLRQPAADLEVVAVDDGSTDRTLSILRSYEGRLPLRILTPEPARNWVATTNRAIEAAEGTWLSFLHQDDFWLPGRLARVRAAVERRPEATFVVHATRYVDRESRFLGVYHPPFPKDGSLLPAALVVPPLLVQNVLAMPSPTLLRSAVREAGGLDPGLWYTADWDLWLRMAVLGRTLYLPEVLAAYRIHPGSQTSRRSGGLEEFESQHRRVVDRHRPPGGERELSDFSIRVNTALAALANGRPAGLGALAGRALALGPERLGRYARWSRVAERVVARLRERRRAILR